MSLARLGVIKAAQIGARSLASGPIKPVNPPQPKTASAPQPNPSTIGKAGAVGPGASKDGPYKNPEYYTYNPMSFYDIEKDMKPFRITQPSSLKK